MTLTLPLCPSANRYWRVYRGRAVKSSVARNYIATVAVLARAARVALIPAPTPVALTVRWQRRERRGDLDNRLKIVQDALQGIAFESDSQVQEIHAYREDGHHANRLIVTVQPATDQGGV